MGTAATVAPHYGPVELHVITLPDSEVSAGLLSALLAQIDKGVVRLLDFVVVTKSVTGTLGIEEVDLDEFGIDGLTELAHGLTSEEDLLELGVALAPGTGALVVALELLWAAELAEQLATQDSVVIATERIPAPVVNTVMSLIDDED